MDQQRDTVGYSQEWLTVEERVWGMLVGDQTSKNINWYNLLDKFTGWGPAFTWLSQCFPDNTKYTCEQISMLSVYTVIYHSIYWGASYRHSSLT